MRYTVLLIAAAVAGCADSVATAPPAVALSSNSGAQFDQVHQKTDETSAQSFVSCNGETVDATVDEQTELKILDSKNGNTHYDFRVHDRITGTGETTGAKYQGESDEHFDIHDTPQHLATLIQTSLALHGQGKIPDTNVQFKFEVRIDDKGNAVNEKIDTKSTCK